MSDINELKFDKKNFNKHTEYGMSLLEKSLRDYGAGRSVLVDKDNNIIAGNGIVESAINAGITKTRVVETNGDELVVVKRNDVELDSSKGRGMAFADNATASVDLDWDDDLLRENFSDEELGIYGIELKEVEDDEKEVKGEIEFTEVLGEENNYLVLKFNNEVDWLSAMTIFGIEKKRDYYTSRNAKITQEGLGRVVDGVDILRKLGVM